MNSVPFAPALLNLVFILLAWKSQQLEHEDISLKQFSEGIQTSRSYVLHAENPMSPVQSSTTLYGNPSLVRISSAWSVSFSRLRIESSGLASHTSSTLLN